MSPHAGGAAAPEDRPVCRYLALHDGTAAAADRPSADAILRAIRGGRATFVCGLRGPQLAGVYVVEMCASTHYHDCVFLEDHRSR